MESNATQKPKLSKTCVCGKQLNSHDAEFWGECDECRLVLPIKTRQKVDYSAMVDRAYNGDMFNSGEW